MRTFVLGGAAVAALIAVGSAQAADLPARPAPVYKAPAMVAPAFSWTGCYLGVNIGGAWAHDTWTDQNPPTAVESNPTASGVVGGGQVGCDYQAGPVVFGVEGMFDGMGLKGSAPDVFVPTISENDQYRWLATVTGRIGYAIDHVLIYAKGGGAWLNTQHSFSGTLIDSQTQTTDGWVAGGGIEWAFAPGWSTKLEYDHIDTSAKTSLFPVTLIPFSFKERVDMVTAGLNYRFHW